MRVLRTARLLLLRRHGATRICELDAGPLRAIDGWLRSYEAFRGASLASLKCYIAERPSKA